MKAEGEKGFKLYRHGKIQYLQSPLLAGCPGVVHAFSTRVGGCSEGAMASLNTAFHTGDEYSCVCENRRRFLEPWGFRPDEVVAAIQVHGVNICEALPGDRGRGAVPRSFLGEGDALVTAVPHLPLTGYAADCPLLFIAAPDVAAVALAHAGWRGTLQNMAERVIGRLYDRFGADPASMLVAISPGICGRCYTVERSVAASFIEAGWSGPPYLWESSCGGFHLDLAAINAVQLRSAGIEKENMAPGVDWCTSCKPGLFYSYRREKGKTGRMMGLIALQKQSSTGKAVKI
ncbi:MAG: laccase domain-containing protein [Firmicutes bacterium]|nr:laccase domain-containing protein [Bacillota bacterium]